MKVLVESSQGERETGNSLTFPQGVVKVGAVDADKHQSLGGQYGVQGFPTIKIFGSNKNRPEDYQGKDFAGCCPGWSFRLSGEGKHRRELGSVACQPRHLRVPQPLRAYISAVCAGYSCLVLYSAAVDAGNSVLKPPLRPPS